MATTSLRSAGLRLDPENGDHFRSVLGRFPTGLTVITGMSPDGPVGFTCQAFSSLSLDPPLIAVFPSRRSTSWPRISQTGAFCVNVLNEDQEHISDRFGRAAGEKFQGLPWYPSPASGSPVIDEAAAWLDCSIEEVHSGGDHHIVVGRVHEMHAHPLAEPLLFHRGKYDRLQGRSQEGSK